MQKNYYLVLGVSSDASADDIKDAYRKLAKSYHPDHYGQNASPFLAIQEAYTVLSDPAKRQTHDRKIRGKRRRSTTRSRWGTGDPGPILNHGTPVEPLIPEKETLSSYADQTPFTAWQNRRPVYRGPGDFNITVSLTPSQTIQGGQIKAVLPIEAACPSCAGHFRFRAYRCPRCHGSGFFSGSYPVIINYPPGISHNDTMQAEINLPGVGSPVLTIRFLVPDCNRTRRKKGSAV